MANIQRLQRALEIMQALPYDRVDMGYVMDECGSCGCILGHCLLDRETFPEIQFQGTRGWHGGFFYTARGPDFGSIGGPGLYDFVASDLFSIDIWDAQALFGPAFDDNWLDDYLFPDDWSTRDRIVAIRRLEFAIARYSRGLPLRPERA